MRLLMIIVPLMIVGCSKQTIYKEPRYPRLEVIELNLSKIERYQPDVEVVDGGNSVKLSVNALLKIKNLMNRCRRDRDILLRVYQFYKKQTKKYNKEFVDDRNR